MMKRFIPDILCRAVLVAVKTVKWAAAVFFGASLLLVLLFRFVNPPVSTLMLYQAAGKLLQGELPKIQKHWVPVEKISPKMIRAVIASEDNLFISHWGIDTGAVEKAIEHNRRSKRKHGASTISQQTAKNVFLWPGRSYLRKALELYFTILIERIWGKRRIMEVYLNVIETGDGIYGVEEASRVYFNTSCRKLSDSQAALIAVSLPSPGRLNPAKPGKYMQRRKNQIIQLMYNIETLQAER